MMSPSRSFALLLVTASTLFSFHGSASAAAAASASCSPKICVCRLSSTAYGADCPPSFKSGAEGGYETTMYINGICVAADGEATNMTFTDSGPSLVVDGVPIDTNPDGLTDCPETSPKLTTSSGSTEGDIPSTPNSDGGAKLCGVCPDNGSAMSMPDRRVPRFEKDDSYGDPLTCGDKNNQLSSIVGEDDCFDAKLKWEVDLAAYCGCESYQFDPIINGDCTLCLDGETMPDPAKEIGPGSFPVMDLSFTCSLIDDVAPFVKYISTCDDLQSWYGTDLCCHTKQSAAPNPGPSPDPAATSAAVKNIVSNPVLAVVLAGQFAAAAALCG